MFEPYIKRPITVQAVQLTHDNIFDVAQEITNQGGYRSPIFGECPDHKFMIRTLEGDMSATIGDYVIKGIKGEFYPCKPDIFEATYTTEKEQR